MAAARVSGRDGNRFLMRSTAERVPKGNAPESAAVYLSFHLKRGEVVRPGHLSGALAPSVVNNHQAGHRLCSRHTEAKPVFI